MPWRGPSYKGEFPTLGWVALDWASTYLPSPAAEKEPLVYTDEQATIVLQWFGLDPKTREFPFRRGALEDAKGWGKSPFMASLALFEFAGPARFDGWDANGEPVGVPWGIQEGVDQPWVQIAAVAEDQTENTYAALYEMLTANEHRAARDLEIDEGLTRLYLKGRPGSPRLEPVTARFGTREGQRVTFAVLDETHLWTPSNGGRKLAGTIRRNVAKMDGRSCATTNAPALGEKSVAEQTGKDAEAGAPGIFFHARRPSKEPDPKMSDKELLRLVDEVYGDAWWAPKTRILKEIRDPASLWEDVLRFWFNIRAAGAGRAVDPRRWNALKDVRDVEPGTFIGLGFDGSISKDATVLRGCTRDGYSFILDSWLPGPDDGPDWTIPRHEVHEAVNRAFGTYRVGRMYCDPPHWWTEIEDWAVKYGDEVVLALDTNQARRFAPATDRWLTAIREGTHTHDGDPLTDEHVKSAHLRKAKVSDPEDDNRTLFVLVKGSWNQRIDAAVADVLAHEAAMTMPDSHAAEAIAITIGG
jgi:hypothetical protein